MKKLALFLIVLVSLAVVVGCQGNKKTVTRFSPDTGSKEVATATTETPAPETIVKVKNSTESVKPQPIELKTEPTAEKTVTDVLFEVTSLEKNTSTTQKGYHLIEGTTPATTTKIMVNGFPLSKYKAGDTKWSYIAAVSLGNLKKGDNPFTVQALDKDGNALGSKNFTITYLTAETAKLPATGPDMFLFLIPMSAAVAYVFRRRA